jgi:hypothetical protein
MTNKTLTREEWTRRFAARMMEVGGVLEHAAMDMAVAAAAENLEYNGDEWQDPEDDADDEMSFWENDE